MRKKQRSVHTLHMKTLWEMVEITKRTRWRKREKKHKNCTKWNVNVKNEHRTTRQAQNRKRKWRGVRNERNDINKCSREIAIKCSQWIKETVKRMSTFKVKFKTKKKKKWNEKWKRQTMKSKKKKERKKKNPSKERN